MSKFVCVVTASVEGNGDDGDNSIDRMKPVLPMHSGRLSQPSGYRPPKVAPNVTSKFELTLLIFSTDIA